MSNNHKYLKIFSRAVGVVFHPLFVPIYITLILLYGDSSLSFFSPDVKRAFVSIIIFTTIIIPVIIMVLLKYVKIVPSFCFERSVDRAIPLMVIAICYMVTQLFVIDELKVFVFSKIFSSASSLVFLLAIISYYSKISLHSAALGAASAILYILMFLGFGNFEIWLILSLVVAGVVCSARMYLGKNNLYQIFSGIIIGFLMIILIIAL